MRYGCTTASVHSHCLRKFVCGSNCLLWSHHAPVTPAVLYALYPTFVPGHTVTLNHTPGAFLGAAESCGNSLNIHYTVVLEDHSGEISLRAKARHYYRTVRLPQQFSALAGVSTHILQTVHKGALAFLGLSHLRTHQIAGIESGETTLLAESSVDIRRR